MFIVRCFIHLTFGPNVLLLIIITGIVIIIGIVITGIVIIIRVWSW